MALFTTVDQLGGAVVLLVGLLHIWTFLHAETMEILTVIFGWGSFWSSPSSWSSVSWPFRMVSSGQMTRDLCGDVWHFRNTISKKRLLVSHVCFVVYLRSPDCFQRCANTQRNANSIHGQRSVTWGHVSHMPFNSPTPLGNTRQQRSSLTFQYRSSLLRMYSFDKWFNASPPSGFTVSYS